MTVAVVSSLYTVESVVTSFFGASAMFGGAAIYGATTKRNLNSIGAFLFMGMIGILVASVVNISPGQLGDRLGDRRDRRRDLHGYTAYDVQKISYGDYAAALGSMEKASIFGAVAPLRRLHQHLPVPAPDLRQPPLGFAARGLSSGISARLISPRYASA